MAVLFVDCDDTLVEWKRAKSLRGEPLWEPNWDVIAAIERWSRSGGEVVVWSERGADYAATWARRAAPHLNLVSDKKDLTRPRSGDIAIDDTVLAINGVCYLPNQCMLIAARG